uniref:Uncharacterized protein n=1 Tax=Mycobacterium riyadhense TaxID=486698 RepID=A0A653EKL9_9MYCO|nr:hypothetical protein BIN_B_02378 [Mycobacterium riyadhense]
MTVEPGGTGEAVAAGIAAMGAGPGDAGGAARATGRAQAPVAANTVAAGAAKQTARATQSTIAAITAGATGTALAAVAGAVPEWAHSPDSTVSAERWRPQRSHRSHCRCSTSEQLVMKRQHLCADRLICLGVGLEQHSDGRRDLIHTGG